MKTLFVLVLMLIGLCQSSCVSTKKASLGQVQKRYATFGLRPLEHWEQKPFRGADLFFVHDKKNASIFFNAQCEQVSDSPLEALLAQAVIGLGKVHREKEERAMLAGREALLTEMTATIDGVPRFLKLMVLKKNRCVFDAVFNAPLAERDLVRDFDLMLASFWAEAAL